MVCSKPLSLSRVVGVGQPANVISSSPLSMHSLAIQLPCKYRYFQSLASPSLYPLTHVLSREKDLPCLNALLASLVIFLMALPFRLVVDPVAQFPSLVL